MGVSDRPFTEKDVPDLSSYVIIVTGGNSGIGYETSYQLALRGARVYITSRSRSRGEAAITEMRKSSGGKQLDLRFLAVDLSSLASVKAAADEFERLEPRLDVLINNAGVMNTPFKLTEDGYETQFQTNFLAPHALTRFLMPLLLSTAAADQSKSRVRVVNVSADAAFMLKTMQFDDVNMTKTSGTMELWKRYGHSKQASIRATHVLNEQYASQGVHAFSLHPGILMTGLQGHDPTFMGTFVRTLVRFAPGFSDTMDVAIRASLMCATSPNPVLMQLAGGYFPKGGVMKHDARADKWVGKSMSEEERRINEQVYKLGEDFSMTAKN